MNKIWIVDAFSDKPYQGNPAAVMLVDDFFPDEECQAIAAEVNLSETAFVKRMGENSFHIRWFTPKVEVQLCGHATLAAAHILFEEKIATSDFIQLDSLSGPLEVMRKSRELILDFPLQKTSDTLNQQEFENLLGLSQGIERVVRAHDDVIIELCSEALVRNFIPHFAFLEKIEARGVIITARGTHEFDFVSRFFAPRVGVNEDPVTGSAHCKLAHYWGEKLQKTKMVACQVGLRGGKIGIEIDKDRVFLKGHAVTVMAGSWQV